MRRWTGSFIEVVSENRNASLLLYVKLCAKGCDLKEGTVDGRRCAGETLARDAAGEKRLAAGLDSLLHGRGHQHRLLRAGDGRVHVLVVAAEIHRLRRGAGGADAGVDLDRHLGGLDDCSDV